MSRPSFEDLDHPGYPENPNSLRIFFDTEFTDLSIHAKLISMGLVDETGERTFYAELSDTWQEKEASGFAHQAVLPLLGDPTARIPMVELRRQLAAWLMAFNEPILLATDSLAWDWMWIADVLGTPGGATWPVNLDPKPDLLQLTQEFQEAVEGAFDAGLRRHHALDDAQANRLAWLAIRERA